MLSLKARAFNFLARRDYASRELIEKLATYATTKEAEAVVAELVANGIVCDKRYIISYINSKQNKFGLLKIRFLLYNKVGNNELVDDTLANFAYDQIEAAHKIWERRFNSLPTDAKEKARQMRFLQYRGFSLDIIQQVFAQAKEDFGSPS